MTTYLIINSGSHQLRIYFDGFHFYVTGRNAFDFYENCFFNEQFKNGDEIMKKCCKFLTWWCHCTFIKENKHFYYFCSPPIAKKFFENKEAEKQILINMIESLKFIDLLLFFYCLSKKKIPIYFLK
jgi:hypothetical protein